MNTLVRFKRKLTRFLGKDLVERIEVEAVTPRPDSLKEVKKRNASARYSVSSLPEIDLSFEENTLREERWDNKHSKENESKETRGD